MRGAIGAPINGREGDVDYYRVPAGKGARVVHARLEGVPGVDLVLELFDAQGRRLAKSDARGRGGGEWLQPTSIGPTRRTSPCARCWVEGQKPTEDPNDPYSSRRPGARRKPAGRFEPNDWPAAATPLAAGDVDPRLSRRRRGQGLVRHHARDEDRHW